jgi:UDP-2,4-diacetamido-2,4,6-trideoxy-beta-L-altropyranose hydrolase
MINVAIRADASHQIGIGHVMRCLTLAQELRCQFKTVRVIFLCRRAKGCVTSKILNAGFECIQLSPGFDNASSHLKHGSWLRASQKLDAVEFQLALNKYNIDYLDLVIVDHYGIDHEWHKLVKIFTKKLFVIDDLGDRTLDCDYLLDQTFGCKKEKYRPLVNDSCKLLLGTKYALLRSEFREITVTEHATSSLLVMFGGSDPDNLTLRVLKTISNISLIEKVFVILNSTAKHLSEVTNYCQQMPHINLYIAPNNIAQIMCKSTLAIGAAGSTSWERCAVGLPSVVVVEAVNQIEIASSLEKEKVITYVGAESIESELIAQINYWIYLLSTDNDIVSKCQNICDGFGAVRVVEKILND